VFDPNTSLKQAKAGLLTYSYPDAFPPLIYTGSGQNIRNNTKITAAGTVQEFPGIPGSPDSLLSDNLKRLTDTQPEQIYVIIYIKILFFISVININLLICPLIIKIRV